MLVNDTNSTIGNSPVSEFQGSGTLLANDYDPDGDQLTITAINGLTSTTVTGTYGTLVWNADGTYTYTPNSELDSLDGSESVTDIFTETVSDGHGGSSTSTLTITISGEVINHAPVAQADSVTIPEDTKNELINVLNNDLDPDGNSWGAM